MTILSNPLLTNTNDSQGAQTNPEVQQVALKTWDDSDWECGVELDLELTLVDEKGGVKSHNSNK